MRVPCCMGSAVRGNYGCTCLKPERAPRSAPLNRKVRRTVKAVLHDIVDLSAGWDQDGSTGPRPPLSWETVARMAMDYARAGLAKGKP